MADDEQFSLCWNNFNSNLSAGFHESLCRGDLVDVTLAAEGQLVKAHRLVLSVCSPYFRKMFTQMPPNQHAFVFLKDVSHTALKDLIQFMYCGEVNVKQEALPAFISTAEALQIKGLTDSDPPASQSPAKPSTPAPQPSPIQQIPSPRVRHRASTSRSYNIESIDDSVDDNKQTTQIVIQTTPQKAQTTTIVQQPQQHHHQTQQQQQQHYQPQQTTTNVTATNVTHKRPAQRNSSGITHTKRTKSTIDPLEVTETVATSQQISVQTVVADTKPIQQQQQQQSEPEFMDLPIELPTKSEPDYTEETGEAEAAEQEATYVEDDSYGDMRYDESYFTENEDAANATATGVSGNIGGAGASTSKAIVKQQPFSDTSYAEAADQSNNEAQVFLKDVSHTALKDLIQFMYCGQVNVRQEALHDFISAAEALQIRGLTDGSQGLTDANGSTSHFPTKSVTPTPIQQIHKNPTVALGTDYIQNEKIIPIADETKSEPQNEETIPQKSQSQEQYPLNIAETVPIVTQPKRSAQCNSGNTFQIKRTKSTTEPTEPNTSIVPEIDSDSETFQQQYDSKLISMPQQPERQCKQETDDGELIRYDERYFTDTEEARNAHSGGVSNNIDRDFNTSLKAIVKHQFFNYSHAEENQKNNDRQESNVAVYSATSRGRVQLIYGGQPFIFEKNLKLAGGEEKKYWRCNQWWNQKCRSRVFTINDIVVPLNRYHTHEEIVKRKKRVRKTVQNTATVKASNSSTKKVSNIANAPTTIEVTEIGMHLKYEEIVADVTELVVPNDPIAKEEKK